MKIALLCLMALALAACGGSGSSGNETANADPGGIWVGTDPTTNQQLEGIVDESGALEFLDSGGTLYSGTITTSGNSATGTLDAFAPLGSDFSDGSTHARCTFSGVVTPQHSASGTASCTTDSGSQFSSDLALTFEALYNNGSSAAAIVGSYAETGDITATVYADGTFTYQNALNGCTASGTITPVQSAYDAYKVSAQVNDCVGTLAGLNGQTVTGLATYDNQTSPPTLMVGASVVTADEGNYGIVLFLTEDSL